MEQRILTIENQINDFIKKIEENSFSSEIEVGATISEIFAKISIIKNDNLRKRYINELYRIRETFARKGREVDVFAIDALLNSVFKDGDLNMDFILSEMDKRNVNKKLNYILKKMLGDDVIENCANCGDYNKPSSVVVIKKYADTIVVVIEDKTLITYKELEVILTRVLRELGMKETLEDMVAVTSVNDKEVSLFFNDVNTKPITIDLKGVDMTIQEKGYYLAGFKQYIDK